MVKTRSDFDWTSAVRQPFVQKAFYERFGVEMKWPLVLNDEWFPGSYLSSLQCGSRDSTGSAAGYGQAAVSPAAAVTEDDRLAQRFIRETQTLGCVDRDSMAPPSLASTDLNVTTRAYYPSPEDWRAEVLYAVVLDRFARAEAFLQVGDPSNGNTRHGGNITGLNERLSYIKVCRAVPDLHPTSCQCRQVRGHHRSSARPS